MNLIIRRTNPSNNRVSYAANKNSFVSTKREAKRFDESDIDGAILTFVKAHPGFEYKVLEA